MGREVHVSGEDGGVLSGLPRRKESFEKWEYAGQGLQTKPCWIASSTRGLSLIITFIKDFGLAVIEVPADFVENKDHLNNVRHLFGPFELVNFTPFNYSSLKVRLLRSHVSSLAFRTPILHSIPQGLFFGYQSDRNYGLELV